MGLYLELTVKKSTSQQFQDGTWQEGVERTGTSARDLNAGERLGSSKPVQSKPGYYRCVARGLIW
eukprot:1752307-Amphidinium_carterae.1